MFKKFELRIVKWTDQIYSIHSYKLVMNIKKSYFLSLIAEAIALAKTSKPGVKIILEYT